MSDSAAGGIRGDRLRDLRQTKKKNRAIASAPTTRLVATAAGWRSSRSTTAPRRTRGKTHRSRRCRRSESARRGADGSPGEWPPAATLRADVGALHCIHQFAVAAAMCRSAPSTDNSPVRHARSNRRSRDPRPGSQRQVEDACGLGATGEPLRAQLRSKRLEIVFPNELDMLRPISCEACGPAPKEPTAPRSTECIPCCSRRSRAGRVL